jgi:hypothetical protein
MSGWRWSFHRLRARRSSHSRSPTGLVIPGAGGFAKPAGREGSKGKSGGFRIIYFFLVEPGRIYMADIYAKSRKENLSGADRNALAKLAAQIKKAARGVE